MNLEKNNKRKTILITGLTLCVNRGGPAMALSFMSLLKQHISADFIFAVPRDHWDLEVVWAEKYGVKIVHACEITDYYLQKIPYPLTHIVAVVLWRRWVSKEEIQNIYAKSAGVVKKFKDAAVASDCIININGIAFVGDGTRSWISSFYELSSSFFSKKYKKPFFRYTQSYGPFHKILVRMIARNELLKLPCILARGDISAKNCRELVPVKVVHSFPDVAIVLEPVNNEWLNSFLYTYNLKKNGFVVLSPSTVIYNMPSTENSSLGRNHIIVFSNLVQYFIKTGIPVLFVPHTTSPNQNECDRHVSKQVVTNIKSFIIPVGMCQIIEEELDCQQLKSVISASQFAVVSRYHALVAALSTGVPSISLGWNDKYQDLLNFYNVGEYSVDSRSAPPDQITEQIIEKINCYSGMKKTELVQRQKILEFSVHNSIIICANWINNMT